MESEDWSYVAILATIFMGVSIIISTVMFGIRRSDAAQYEHEENMAALGYVQTVVVPEHGVPVKSWIPSDIR